MRKTFIHFLWKAFFAVLLFVAVAFAAIWFGLIGYMPDLEELQNPISRSATQVFSELQPRKPNPRVVQQPFAPFGEGSCRH